MQVKPTSTTLFSSSITVKGRHTPPPCCCPNRADPIARRTKAEPVESNPCPEKLLCPGMINRTTPSLSQFEHPAQQAMVTKPAGRQQTEQQRFPSQSTETLHSKSTQLDPAATQQPPPGTNSLVIQGEFSGTQQTRRHVPSLVGTAHAWLTASPVCFFCSLSSPASLFITQAHQLPASDQLGPVEPGNHLHKPVPLSSCCLSGNTWRYSALSTQKCFSVQKKIYSIQALTSVTSSLS